MDLSAFHYELPDELIARYPARARSASRLLVLDERSDGLLHSEFRRLHEHLREGDLLVVNDTRVIPARLFGRKDSGGRVELLIERIVGDREALAHVKASKTLKSDRELRLDGGATATVCGRSGELYRLRFDCDIGAFIDRHGHVPLPPYLGRGDQPVDRERYQTVFAELPGAVAAPTAGLHFDATVLERLSHSGVGIASITLHVGAGTFQNLRPEHLRSGRLHAEPIVVDDTVCERIERTRAGGGRVVAVGTTSARALETAARDGKLRPYTGETELFIRPGFRFGAIDGLLTNFHLPESSLLMLVCAFAGTNRVMTAYREAIARKYRFYSYGDAMLVWRGDHRSAIGGDRAV